ncbi:alpha/beta hydrolase [Novosphingobium sp.]|uniref:alpha/beta fold hydrolase n=1 Tax=Novosphingobium sp. TaxID=1874826 RepID=UPI0025E18ACC|nr:alpha/beta hydrolase [Novosphingobium sp.]MCC6925944.1 alpha/beta hydrolase [Novosphingobium sp.]
MPLATDPASFGHHLLQANGIQIHYVDEGSGPLVILLHGFPYTWFEWRHQIVALAHAGYRVIAPDIRGFGESGKPANTEDYTILHCAGDVVALLAALGERRAVLVGHDLGAWVAAAATRLRPALFPALVLVSTVVPPREAQRPSEGWAEIEARTGGRFYHHYFQQPGLADVQFDQDPAVSLRSIYNAISGTASEAERWRLIVMPGETALDTLPDPGHAPAWLGEHALAEYVRHYVAGGFTPPLAHYRCRDLNWKLTAAWAGQAITQPSLFVGGAADPALTAMQSLYDRMEEIYPGLVRKALLPGVGHGAPEESPEQISRELVTFLDMTLPGLV